MLRTWRISFCWLRLIWLLMFATGSSRVSLDCGPATRRPGQASGARGPRCHLAAGQAGSAAEAAAATLVATCPLWTSIRIRNLSIIAHIDHGKSTLADRMLELSGAVDPRDMRDQYLDSMDLERERGITIKLQIGPPRLARPRHQPDRHARPRRLRLRGVAAAWPPARASILLVDAAQGIEAQTLANCYLALENDLEIVAALNKIDLPAADPDRYAAEIEKVLGIPADEILRISAKTGEGVRRAARRRRRAHPAADGRPRRAAAGADLRLALRPVPGRRQLGPGHERHAHAPAARLRFMQAGAIHDADEIGVRTPDTDAGRRARPGRGRLPHRRHQGRRRGPRRARPSPRRPAPAPSRSTGYRDPKPMVFCGLYPIDGDEFADLREALEKLRLNDCQLHLRARDAPARSASGSAAASSACCTWRSSASGSSASSTSASSPPPRRSSTSVHTHRRRGRRDRQPVARCPPPGEIERIEEPYLTVTILTPTDYTGTLMELCQTPAGRDAEDGVPVARAARARLPAAAGRGRHATSSTS